ncbi:MAG: TetR/AcrR family transcriptional regulator [Chloroflexi bacterium]|nr:TetR/AcrR family transcriptional regulator [Chloroflexota bacterium]
MYKRLHKRKHSEQRQKQIVAAARKLIIKHGSEHVTVRRIARETGISEGAIYRHFKSKKDILLLLIDSIEDNLIEDIEKNLAPGQPRLEMLDDMIRDHLSSIEQRKGVTFLVIAEIISLGDRNLNHRILGVLNKYTELIREILAAGIRTGEVRPDLDLDIAARLFFGMMQGMASFWALSDYRLDLQEGCLSAWHILRQAVRGEINRVDA